MTPAEAQRLLDATVARLSEHFTSVQVIVTNLEPNRGTAWHASGSGDWYARRGACQEFIERDQAQTVALTIKDVNEPGDE